MRLTTPKTVLIFGGKSEQRELLSEWLSKSLPSVSPLVFEMNEDGDLQQALLNPDMGCAICILGFDAMHATELLDIVQHSLQQRWDLFRQPKERQSNLPSQPDVMPEISIARVKKESGDIDSHRALPVLVIQDSSQESDNLPVTCRQVNWSQLEADPALLSEYVMLVMETATTQEQNHKLKQRVRKLDEELLVKQQKLTEMTETALRFTDSVSHEFRTPLTVIKEFAGIIREGIGGPVTPQQHEFLNYIDSATRDITRLVEDFLDSSRLKAGTLYVNRRQVRLLDYFERLQPLLATHAATKKVDLHYIIMDEIGHMYCDLDKACRSLTNLVVHGIKHACEKEILWIWSVPLESGEYAMGVTSHTDWQNTYGQKHAELPDSSEDSKDKLNSVFQAWLLSHLPVDQSIHLYNADGRVSQNNKETHLVEPAEYLINANETRDSLSKWGLGLSVVEDLSWMNLGDVKLWPKFEGSQRKLDEIIGTDHVGHRSFLFTIPSARLDCVLEQYAKHMMDAGMEPSFTALRVLVSSSAISSPISRDQKIRHFLSSNSRSMDLVWHGQSEGEFILLGSSDKPDAWRERLLLSWDNGYEETMIEEDVKLNIETLGEWSAEQVNDLSLMDKPFESRPWFRSLYEVLAPLTNLDRGQMHQRLKKQSTQAKQEGAHG